MITKADSYILVDNESTIYFPESFWEYSYGLSHVPSFVQKIVERHVPKWRNFKVVRNGKSILGSVR